MTATPLLRIVETAPARPRRILHVFPSFEVGGAQMRFTHLVRGLGRSYQHTVISLRGDCAAPELACSDDRQP